MTFKPLPTKTRVSIDVPALLAALRLSGEYKTSAKFEDLLVVRNYMARHNMTDALTQKRVEGGFILGLRSRDGSV